MVLISNSEVSFPEYLPENYKREKTMFLDLLTEILPGERLLQTKVTVEGIPGYQQRCGNHLKIKERKSLLILAFPY
jgi:hypothetical protein